MANVFLSYSRDDRPTAQIIAEALQEEGLEVWWDKVLRAGQTYDEVTETMLRDAEVVIVLWSQTSVKSKWVRAEATLGQRHCELVPAMIEEAERPIMFELVQTADLIGWQGDRSEERWINFVEDVRRSLNKAEAAPAKPAPAPTPVPAVKPQAPPPEPPPQPTQSNKKKGGGGMLPILIGLLILAGGGWYGYQTFLNPADTDEPPTELVVAEPSVATCAVCPDMVEIPGGTFTMGSPADEPDRSGNEGPQRSVTVAPFALSKTEITRAEWALCVEAGACRAAQGSGSDAEPVTGVSWNDATAYADWLSAQSGDAYRLPTEAEWEYAARAGTETAYWWGPDFPGPGAVRQLRDVASLPSNAFGVSGLLGNVREWVADCYVNNYRNAPDTGQVVTSGDCQRPIVRGGSFENGRAEHRAANRARYPRETRDRRLGFRVVSAPEN